MSAIISGFSKLSKSEKIDWIVSHYLSNSKTAKHTITQYFNADKKLQQLHDEFIENTISNYYLPLGVAPNFQINGKTYVIPMAIEESSVVAAASNAAKFWMERGGFKAKVLSTTKIGQVHFMYDGNFEDLKQYFNTIKPKLITDSKIITANMEKRGGGILDIELRNKTEDLKNYYQLHATFETLDAMGANFINSCLEQFAKTLKTEAIKHLNTPIEIVMSILSNYVPDCLVRAEVSCKVEDLKHKGINGKAFAEKFVRAVNIAEVEPHRAVTHNKGIMNGIDAVVLATGNDFRAVEAGVHAYAVKNGKYTSLTHAKIEDDIFSFWMEIPLALGTVGGLTRLHPLVKVALDILGKPSAKELMQIVAVAGLAQNFAALRSLTTTGIQEGHMKMHLMNILNQFNATKEEKEVIVNHFKSNTVTHSAVVLEIEKNKTIMQQFYSHGKLLLTAEYVVLDGAKALALPTKFGQTLTVETIDEQKLVWKSLDFKGNVWFEDEFILSNRQITTSKTSRYDLSERLIEILNECKQLNSEFLNSENGYKVTSTLEFPNNWGLGSSSTLLNNIAQWAKVDAFALSNATFGGSGYDIACAQNDTAIVYQLVDSKPLVKNIAFNKIFRDELFFVHLNRKQNSRDSIKTYNDNKRNSEAIISKINSITSKLIVTDSIQAFNALIETHENLIGEITKQTPIKGRLFKDFKNQIKSLGGWNGDFVLATGKKEYVETYFIAKGYHTILSFNDMIL